MGQILATCSSEFGIDAHEGHRDNPLKKNVLCEKAWVVLMIQTHFRVPGFLE